MHKLFDLVKTSKKNEETILHSYQDYEVFIDKNDCPEGVIVMEM